MSDRKSGTSSATNLDIFMSRSVRIISSVSDLRHRQVGQQGECCEGQQALCKESRAHLSGLARLLAPAVRSTDRMLRSPKS